ncbi:MAG: recombination protein RecR [Saprospiraceae bacterium]|nr:recombination protein RecR [Saprospiraceae bacterium]
MNISSKLIEEAVEAFASLPGIGKKTALRLVLHMIDRPTEFTEQFSGALAQMRTQIKICSNCFNISDEIECSICKDTARNDELLCVVENVRDLMAIEETGQFRGRYHVLGGLISPIDGIGPEQLNIMNLKPRIDSRGVKEVIMAVSPTIPGDTTIFFLSKHLEKSGINISTIARGVAFGGELEYADGFTLGRSIEARIPYQIRQTV